MYSPKSLVAYITVLHFLHFYSIYNYVKLCVVNLQSVFVSQRNSTKLPPEILIFEILKPVLQKLLKIFFKSIIVSFSYIILKHFCIIITF